MKNSLLRVGVFAPRIQPGNCPENAMTIANLIKAADYDGVQLCVLPRMCLCGQGLGDLLSLSSLLASVQRATRIVLQETAPLDCIFTLGLPVVLDGQPVPATLVCCGGLPLGLVPERPVHQTTAIVADVSLPVGQQLRFAHISHQRLHFAVGHTLRDCDAPLYLCTSGGPDTDASESRLSTGAAWLSARQGNILLVAHNSRDEASSDDLRLPHLLVVEEGNTLFEQRPFTKDGKNGCAVDVDLARAPLPTRPADVTFAIPLRGQETLRRTVSPFPFCLPDLDKQCARILELLANALATRLRKTSCEKLVLGISGGLDSTLALLVCADAMDLLGLARRNILAVTLPGMGTTPRTLNNAKEIATGLDVELMEIPIATACAQHFTDIGLSIDDRSVAYENAQARERVQVLLDLANMHNGMVVGSCNMSELALGWGTHGGDLVSMYGLLSSLPKTLARAALAYAAKKPRFFLVARQLLDVLATPVSPELLPPAEAAQHTEDILGPYEVLDFLLYHLLKYGYSPDKNALFAGIAFQDQYTAENIASWTASFYRRFVQYQYKRMCLPEGPNVTGLTLSPRGGFVMPGDLDPQLLQSVNEL